MKNNLEKMKKKQQQFIDEIIKESQFRSIFVANMSHDLRNPLNSILGFTDLLIESLKTNIDEQYMDYLKNIYESGQILLNLINNLIYIAKIDTGKLQLNLEEINIANFILDIENSLESLITSKSLKYKYYPCYKSKIMFADKLKLRQILVKLLSNSISNTEEGYIIFKIIESDDKWEFIIIDTGNGIDERELEFIFNPYYKFDYIKIEKGKNIGFDLILAKRLIDLHNGKLIIDLKRGEGSEYSFLIPKTYEII